MLEARDKLLGATQAESVSAAEELPKDYRLNPEGGVLERAVFITEARIWVPVMPTTVVPAECFGEPQGNLTWRRYAFERAHMTLPRTASSRQCLLASSQANCLLAKYA